uniref:Uncharacterized protein n=1 Tax=Rhizophora mucronata TaxID=61149 RepID=A0A2P2L128_RHIMU
MILQNQQQNLQL